MDDALLLIAAAVIIIVVVSVAAKRFGIAAPVALVVVGLLVSLVPGVPTVALEPEWILIGVLPPTSGGTSAPSEHCPSCW